MGLPFPLSPRVRVLQRTVPPFSLSLRERAGVRVIQCTVPLFSLSLRERVGVRVLQRTVPPFPSP